MSTKVDKLIVELDADSAKLRKELEATNQKLDLFGKKAAKSMDTFKSAAIAAVGVFSASKIVGAINGALEFADSIDKAAQAAGVGTQFLQEMRFAADQNGVSMLGLDDSMRRLNRRLGEFINSGGGPAEKAFEKLNISVRDLDGNVRGTEDVFRDIVHAMQGLETTAQKSAVAAQLFGDDFGPKLVTLLNQGVDGIDRLREAAREAGGVLSDDMVRAAVDAKDAMDELSFAGEGLKNELILNMAPALTRISMAMTEAAKDSGALMAAFVGWDGLVTEILGAAFDSDVKNIKDLKQDLADLERQLKNKEGQGALHDWIFGDESDIQNEIRETEAEIARLEKRLEEARKPRPKPNASGAGTGGGSGAGDLDAARKAAEEEDKAFEKMLKASEKAINDAAYMRWVDSMKQAAQKIEDQVNPMNAIQREMEELEVLLEGGYIGWDTYADAVLDAMDKVDDIGDRAKEATQAAQDLGFSFSSAFEDAVLRGGDVRSVLQGMGEDIGRIIMRRTITEPLANYVTSSIGNFFPGFASGGITPGGPVIVGERGPELLVPPAGSRVIPNNEIGGGGSMNVTVNMRVESLDPSRAADVVGGALVQLKPVVSGIVEESYRRRGRRGPLA